MEVTVKEEQRTFTVGDVILATFKPSSPDRLIFQDEAELIGKRCCFVAAMNNLGIELVWNFQSPKTNFFVSLSDLKDIEFLGNEGELKE